MGAGKVQEAGPYWREEIGLDFGGLEICFDLNVEVVRDQSSLKL